MTDDQRTARALLDTPEVYKYLSGNEIRVCEGLIEDPYFLNSSDYLLQGGDEDEVDAQVKKDYATFRNLENTFPREIAAWKEAYA